MSDSLSFDQVAALYDETRGCDERRLDGALDFIHDSFPPARYPWLFEPGVGTGRIAIPLARRGYRIHGVDISPEMLQRLGRKRRETGGGLSMKPSGCSGREAQYSS